MNIFGILQYFLFNDVVTTVSTITVVCALILLTESERYISGAASFVVYLLLLEWFTDADIFSWIWHNKLLTLGYILGYFAMGAVYSAVKYHFFVNDFSDDVLKIKGDFVRNFGASGSTVDEPIPTELQSKWRDYLGTNISSRYHMSTYGNLADCVSPKNQVERLCIWIGYWPFSAVGLLVARPLQRLVTEIYNRLQSIYIRIYNKAIGKLLGSDMEKSK